MILYEYAMQVDVRCTPAEVDAAVRDRVTKDVTEALKAVCTINNQFIVNPTVWYGVNDNGAVKPRVVNSAGFISKTFENYLKKVKGWDRQKKLEGQTIDAYLELPSPPGFQL